MRHVHLIHCTKMQTRNLCPYMVCANSVYFLCNAAGNRKLGSLLYLQRLQISLLRECHSTIQRLHSLRSNPFPVYPKNMQVSKRRLPCKVVTLMIKQCSQKKIPFPGNHLHAAFSSLFVLVNCYTANHCETSFYVFPGGNYMGFPTCDLQLTVLGVLKTSL